MDSESSQSEHAALKALYRLSQTQPAVRSGDLAQALELTPGTVTARVKRLAASGLVTHERYRGVELTASGRRAAVAAIRRHRIVERFLADMLGYPWQRADQLAAAFEHDLPQEVEDRLFLALHRPTACPHGFPIPAVDVESIDHPPPLYALEPGDSAIVAVPGATDPELMEFLEQLGLRPGVRVRVREKHPFDGPLVLVVDGEDRTLGSTVAQRIYVEKEKDLTSPNGAQTP